MCGRYSLTTPVESLRRLFGFTGLPNLAPRYNIAPTQDVPIVRQGAEGRELAMVRWGLVPGWAKDLSIGNRMINARAETLAEKPAFRGSFKARRCLVPADGFYEWRSEGGKKAPYRIVRPDGGPFAFAGLWERWKNPEGAPIDSMTIVTTEANRTLRMLHERMPVILDPGNFALWLERKADLPALGALLVPYGDEGLRYYRVSSAVNRTSHEAPDCVEPIDSGPLFA
jgi:putative SOS response-associated peptidase YedK